MNIKQEILNTRKQNELTNTPQEQRAGELFVGAVERMLEQKEFFDPEAGTVGVEAEFLLVNGDLSPVKEDVRNSVMKSANEISERGEGKWSFQHEMGAAQIEANQSMDAIMQKGFSPNEMVSLFKTLDRDLEEAAKANNAKVLKLGLHPTESLADTDRTSNDKYQIVPNHHIKNRLEESRVLAEELGIPTEPDASAVGLSQALQFNIAAESPKHAVDMVNWLFQITPSVLALTSNASITEGMITDWEEPRNRIWDQTHLTSAGSRVLLPDNGFFHDPESIFKHMGKFPFMLEPDSEFASLAIGTGTKWLASKLKFLADPESLDLEKILVEFRPLSIQQTAEENAAATMFSLGRLFWAKNLNEPLMHFEDVRRNTMTAMKEGMDGMFKVTAPIGNEKWEVRHVNGNEMKRLEMEKAIHGLVMEGHGSEGEIRDFFDKNMPKEAPSKRLVRKLEEEGGIQNRKVMKDTLIKVLSDSGILS